jgi:RHS repeat-associated protein
VPHRTPLANYTYCNTNCNLSSAANARGHLISESTGDVTTQFSWFDAMGRVQQHSEQTPAGTYAFSYLYNYLGLLTQETYPSERVVATSYDCVGRPVGVVGTMGTTPTSYGGGAMTSCTSPPIAYEPHGAIKQLPLGNGLTESWQYNSRLQAAGITATLQSNQLWALQNYFCGSLAGSCSSNNGNVISQTETVPLAGGAPASWSTAYTYDGVNRIASATESGAGLPNGGWGQTYTYTDQSGNNGQFGNMVLSDPNSVTFNSGLSCASYNQSNNRCATAGFTYDNAGNLTNLTPVAGLTLAMTYDAEERQTGITQTPGVATTYLYDAEGRRVQKVSGGQTTTYVYDAMGNLAAEYGGTDAPGCATCYLTPDHLGSTRLITDASGNVVSRYDYTPFGSEIGPSFRTVSGTALAGYAADWTNPKFTGKPRDYETTLGLDYFGARYFSAAQGRFTSPDPLGGNLADPQSLNRYTYVLNNPLRYTDPTGMYTCQDSTDCSSAADKKFEAALASLRTSTGDTARAAAAYGGVNEDNGVTVGFDLTKRGENGSTVSTLASDANGVVRAESAVTISSKISGDDLASTVGHEGSHVADAQDVVNSGITPDGQELHAGMNITPYQSEQRAYGVTNAILASQNQSSKYDCGATACTLGKNSGMPSQLPGVIDQIVAHDPVYNQGGRPMSSTNQGPSVVNGITPKAAIPH